MSLGARGMLDDEEHDGESVASEDDVVMVGGTERNGHGRKGKGKRKGRPSLSAGKTFGSDELIRQTHEIERDKENIYVRRVCLFVLFLIGFITMRGRPSSTTRLRRSRTRSMLWMLYERSWSKTC